jgi:hypothetical protein
MVSLYEQSDSKIMTTKTKNILTAVALAVVAISIYIFAVIRVTS